MLKLSAPLVKPGLFITGTDTEVGKTVVTCAIARAMREQSRELRLGVCKPFATGCRPGRDGPEQEDVQALIHFADCRAPASQVCPQAFRMPASPAAAAEAERVEVNWDTVARALHALDDRHDALLIEGVGGAMVPLDPRFPRYTVRDMIKAIGYPALVVCRAGLGTLNHTAMTVEVLERAGCRVVGLVVNGVDAEASEADPSRATNRQYLERMTGIKVMCEVPQVRAASMDLARGRMDPAVLRAVSQTYWGDLFGVPAGAAAMR